jgi:hypothetical protein
MFVVANMIDSKCTIEHLCTIQIVHCQDGRPLIFVHQETETSCFACGLVPWQVDVYRLSILREDGNDIALGELGRQT